MAYRTQSYTAAEAAILIFRDIYRDIAFGVQLALNLPFLWRQGPEILLAFGYMCEEDSSPGTVPVTYNRAIINDTCYTLKSIKFKAPPP